MLGEGTVYPFFPLHVLEEPTPTGSNNQGNLLPQVSEKLEECWLQVRLDPGTQTMLPRT